MSSELVTAGQPSTDLTIADDQTGFTDSQVAALRHIGVDNASRGDLDVFFHVVKRTGLDPFARQIYMIGRRAKEGDNWVTKQTIQTGIDGYRLIGRRAADRNGDTIAVSAPEWAHEDGSWRPVWSSKWGWPVAARVTIKRNGQPFTAVAIFDEYKQTTRAGGLTAMWAQRPAGQIAKCAEALAWRMAFPQDLAGVYVEDELQHQDGDGLQRPRRATAASALSGPARVVEHEDDPEPAAEPEALSDSTRKRMFALLHDLGIEDPATQRAGMSNILGREVTSRKSLTEDEGRAIVIDLEARLAATHGADQ